MTLSPDFYNRGTLFLCIFKMSKQAVLYRMVTDKRELKCACVGGDSNVPLGLVSLTENLMMVAMGLWMLWGI